jgi:peptide/nickel transport system ATP-binding protein
MSVPPAVSVQSLRVELDSGDPVIDDVGFTVARGEILGLVGESGSGKTTTALALLGYARLGLRISQGEVTVGGKAVVGAAAMSHGVRGRLISYVAQDPAAALNPSLRIRDLLADMVRGRRKRSEARTLAIEALRRVDLPSDDGFLMRYPHQLSGGQQQRVAIALALMTEPQVIVLDEPTTGLDVVTQAHILRQVDSLRYESGLSVIYVTHDLAVVASIADRIAVMYAGHIVEEGYASDVLTAPRHPYTRGLLNALPDHRAPRKVRGIPGVAVGVGGRPNGCAFAPRCNQYIEDCARELPPLHNTDQSEHRARCILWRNTPALDDDLRHEDRSDPPTTGVLLAVSSLCATYHDRRRSVVAADNVSFDVRRGECLALVGESGSGKTTIARCIAGLHEPISGEVVFDGNRLAYRARARPREARRRLQIIFQNPADTLNPYHTVAEEIIRPALILRRVSRSEAGSELDELLDRVRLPRRVATRYARELSGGERQRVAIARALAARPDLLICDEITSSLDASVQAAVLELLGELQADLTLGLLFISHDLGVVASIAQRVIVLEGGATQEEGRTDVVLRSPQTEYTTTLIEAVPTIDRRVARP